MAFMKDIVFKGIEITGAYCRISTVACQKDTGINFQIDVYYNMAARLDINNVLFSVGYNKSIDLDSNVNIFEECYVFLKTCVPDWSNAESC